MSKKWQKVLSGLLSLAMVLTMAGVGTVRNGRTAKAAETYDTFTLYYYYEGEETLYLDVWDGDNLSFTTNDTTVTDPFGWNKQMATLQPVTNNDNWYSTELKINDQASGFTIYIGSDNSNKHDYDLSQDYYKVIIGGTQDAYALNGYTLYTDLSDAGLSISSGSDELQNTEIDVKKVSGLSNDFIMGMDISSAISEFESGVTFKDWDGNVINNLNDFCKFLKANGITHIRVRVWNNPYDGSGNGYGGGNNDVAKAKTFADACRNAGLKMLVDFHCSDFWTDPKKYTTPKEWKNYTLEQKATALTNYIKDSLNTIDSAKDTVDMVQVGNETTVGFIGETNVANMCTLFSAGITGVKAYNSTVKTVIHLTNPESGKFTTWAKNLKDNGVEDYNILATSYYPYWHGSLSNLTSELKKVHDDYGVDVMVAETSYAYTLNDSDGHDNTVRTGTNDTSENCTEPFTVQGQATDIRNVINAVNTAGGIGVFYWEPAWITVGDVSNLTKGSSDYTAQVNTNKTLWESKGSGWAASYSSDYDPDDAGQWYGGSAVDNEAMFYPDGSPTEGLHVWNYVKTGASSKYTYVDKIKNVEETIEYSASYTLPGTIEVSYNKGTEKDSVTWDSTDIAKIDVNTAGTYIVNGTVTFSKAVDSGEYNGKTTAPVTYTLTVKEKNYLLNPGFEFAKENWTIEGTGSKISEEDPHGGSYGLHFWNNSDFSFTAAQKVTLDAGVYLAGCYLQGGDAGENDAYQFYVTVGDNTRTSDAALKGWKEWQNPEIKGIILTEPTEITVGIKVQGTANAWGTWDDFYVNKYDSCTAGHTLTKVEAKAATTEAEGNKEYWACSECGKLFADENGTTETTLAAVTIPKLESTPTAEPTAQASVPPASNTPLVIPPTTTVPASPSGTNASSGTALSNSSGTTSTAAPAATGAPAATTTAAPPSTTAEAPVSEAPASSEAPETEAPVSEATDTSAPVSETPADTGTTITKSGLTYKVTESSEEEPTVTYTGTTDKNTGKTVTVPSTVKLNGVTYKVTAIAANAFKNDKKITSVTIGKNIQTIGKNAFAGATKLKKVTIGSGVKKIGQNAFKGSTKLTKLIVKSDKLTKAGIKNALKGSSVKTVVLSGSAAKKKLKTYQKIFTKANCGKKVTVKVKG